MSHFSVLVITRDGSAAAIEAALAPYHEFECTGTDDQYVQAVDETEEAREAWTTETRTAFREIATDRYYTGFRKEDGSYDPLFWTPEPPKTGRFIFDSQDRRERVAPEGWEVVEEVPYCKFETFHEFVESYYGKKALQFGAQPDLEGEHKFGYAEVDKTGNIVRVVRRTNPNKKWDWYEAGGRFSNKLTGKDGRQHDSLRMSEIDFEAMFVVQRDRMLVYWDKAYSLLEANVPNPEDRVVPEWSALLKKHAAGKAQPTGPEIDAARDEYRAHPAIVALNADREDMIWYDDKHDFNMSRKDYGDALGRARMCTFAVCSEAGWMEKGEMGWWGIVHDEKDQVTWEKGWFDLVKSLPEDAHLTVVDCHI